MELLKLNIRNYTIPFCIKRKKEQREFKEYLDNLLEELDGEIRNLDKKEDKLEILTQYQIIKTEIKRIEEETTMEV